jgi:hypothetical protein
MTQARSWIRGDQSKWSKLTHEEEEEVETSPKEKLYVRGFVFTG